MADSVISAKFIGAGRALCQLRFFCALFDLGIQHTSALRRPERRPEALEYQCQRIETQWHFTTLTKHIIMGVVYEEPCDSGHGMVKAMAELPQNPLLCRAPCTTKFHITPLESTNYV